jgi:2-dehydro-3-deoxyphosphogluconate aldolase/(4S)-4-hydroxy-2-oxoglutarate aldolase
MRKQQIRQCILDIGVIPVVRASSPQNALLAVDAVRAGGIPIVEITMTVPGALEVISELAKHGGDELLVGAGTVLDPDAARRCIDAGASFLASPGFDACTVQTAILSQTLIMAGALTPTEVIAAWKSGADFVKVFPCGVVGGARYIRALRGPLPEIPLLPTGGINLDNAADFIRAGAAALGIGGELVSSALDYDSRLRTTDLARKFVAVVREAREEQVAISAPRG